MGFFDSWKVGVRVHLRHTAFYPGNIVEGFVELNVSSTIEMVAVRVKATGKEKVVCRREVSIEDEDREARDEKKGDILDLFENESETRMRRRTETYVESSSIYKQLITIAGHTKFSRSRSAMKVPPGRYTYPFAFQLPVDIPPSFYKQVNDDVANIQYHIKAYVDIPMGRDAEHRVYFTVVKPMPQQQWICRAPSSCERHWDVTMCCCIDKGKVSARMFMDRTLISIDRDNLVVCADIDNSLGQEPVQSLEVNLMHRLVFKAGRVTESDVVNEGCTTIRNQHIPAGGKGRLSGEIHLPRRLVPSLKTFNITSEYWVDIELNIPMASDPKHRIPVIVVQTVDESNFVPPVQWNQCTYSRIMKGQSPEFYYQPPPKPCYQLAAIPDIHPPTDYHFSWYPNEFFSAAGEVLSLLPNHREWSGPTNYSSSKTTTTSSGMSGRSSTTASNSFLSEILWDVGLGLVEQQNTLTTAATSTTNIIAEGKWTKPDDTTATLGNWRQDGDDVRETIMPASAPGSPQCDNSASIIDADDADDAPLRVKDDEQGEEEHRDQSIDA